MDVSRVANFEKFSENLRSHSRLLGCFDSLVFQKTHYICSTATNLPASIHNFSEQQTKQVHSAKLENAEINTYEKYTSQFSM